MKYIVEITGTLQKQIEIEAENKYDALKKVKAQYNNEDIILNAENLTDLNIDIKENKDKKIGFNI